MNSIYLSTRQAQYGAYVIPIKKIELFSPEEWETFTEEWLDLKKKEYLSIEKRGGAGDKGRDVIAYITDPQKKKKTYEWDCYQCKHYDKPISFSHIRDDLAKIIYYTFKKDYPIPNNYYIIAPKDCGTTLLDRLNNPEQLKNKLKEDWKTDKITINKDDIKLECELEKYFDNFNFSIFKSIPRKKVIEGHREHPNHIVRFGGGLPERERFDKSSISKEIGQNEVQYVKALIEAYKTVKVDISLDALDGIFNKHFEKARLCFHFAEQLRLLYRDNLPPSTFEDFQEEIFIGVENYLLSSYSDDFEKIKAVETASTKVVITSNPLVEVSMAQDKIGICHQLSNVNRISWKDE